MPDSTSSSSSPTLPNNVVIRQALPSDAASIHALMRPFVAQHLLLDRTEAEVIELSRHGFVAIARQAGKDSQNSVEKCVGFSAIEVYSPKLAELQCLAVQTKYQRDGVGRQLVKHCVDRARELNIMEVLAISSSEEFLSSCGFDYSLPDQKKALFCQLRPRHPE